MRVVVVVPMHNESQNVAELVSRLATVAHGLQHKQMSVIFVDDGSIDSTLSAVASHGVALPDFEVVELSRNFGKEAALLAGMDAALESDFDALVIMDADLQHPPEVIPKLVEVWQEGADVVVAARRARAGDGPLRRLLSRMFYVTINRLADVAIADGDGDFRLLDHRVVHELCRLREQDRFTKGLYSWIGFRQRRIYIDFDARRGGRSKFGLSNLFALAGNAVTGFSAKPLRMALFGGIVIGGLSLCYGLWIGLDTVLFGKELPGYASLFCALTFLGGVQLISIGVLGEYVGRAYIQGKARPPYITRRVIKGGPR